MGLKAGLFVSHQATPERLGLRKRPRPCKVGNVSRVALALCFVLLGCGSSKERSLRENATPSAREAERCPARDKLGAELPNTPRALSELSYWLNDASDQGRALDEVLLDKPSLSAQDAALRSGAPEAFRFGAIGQSPDAETVRRELEQRLTFWLERFRSGDYTLEKGDGLALMQKAKDSPFVEGHSLVVALSPITLHCAPMLSTIRSVKGDPRFDRNMCSQVRAQEPLEILGRVGGVRFARSAYAVGFIGDDVPLSPEVPENLQAAYRNPRELELKRDLTLDGVALGAQSFLVSAGEGRAWLAKPSGFSRSRPLTPSEAQSTERPLTRRAFLEEAFRYIDAPYGLGDERGGRDCSRLTLDVLRGFGLHLPRVSVQQSEAGVYTLDIPEEANETERLGVLDEASERGIVLLHFPGHIAFYLGRDQKGVPRLLHSFAEYLRPCDGGGETLVEVDRVAVSDLSLGKNTSRRSFLERITRLSILGKPPGQGLLALARFRPAVPPPEEAAAHCKNDDRIGLFTSPREPAASDPLTVMAVSEQEMRPSELWLRDPAGKLVEAEVKGLGVGPYARVMRVAKPRPGTYTALLADGERVLACRRFVVQKKPVAAETTPREPDAPAWQPRNDWSPVMEALYAAFVEHLFAHPLDDMRTWSSLSELLRDPSRNLLVNYLGLHEDAQLSLSPDCADLPYFLRGYFAWKLGLPFAFRRCSRGRADAAPHCGPQITQEKPVTAQGEVGAFSEFMRLVSNGVHSASGRTLPDDPDSDLYPLPLQRSALKPGSVFVDPYGHLIVVAQWVPQGIAGAGMLLGADAQPDKTVGRRRFWPGNFLFTPETDVFSAGFKGFRPVLSDDSSSNARGAKQAKPGADAYLKRGMAPPSDEQYAASRDAFYQRVDQLIYPRPIAIGDRLRLLVDALYEQVERRIEAVDLGAEYVREHPGTMAMPDGYAIFETEGAWEDFATPSRDMRLLIAIDAVRDFPAQVRKTPERYLASPAEVAQTEALLKELLAARTFRYVRSDGEPQELSLEQLLERSAALEVAYNPNDCVEYRWGAPKGSPELSSCKRRAPAAQQKAMERYRAWFHTRTRPPRP